eukprot:1059228-Pyramimonas_sp.AAC.1
MLLPSRSIPVVDAAPVALPTSRRCCSRRAPYQPSMLLPSRSHKSSASILDTLMLRPSGPVAARRHGASTPASDGPHAQ